MEGNNAGHAAAIFGDGGMIGDDDETEGHHNRDLLAQDKGDPVMHQVVETPGGGSKEMQQAIVAVDVKAPKAAKGGEADHLGDAEKAQHDHDKDDPGAMTRKNVTESTECMVHIGEHIDLLVGLDNPIDHSRRLYALLRTEATVDSWNQLELTADEKVRRLWFMGIIRDIVPSERIGLAPLFANHRHLRPDIDAVLQGYCGMAVANAGPDPLVAQLTINPVTFFGGEPTHPVAQHLVERLVGEKIIIVAEEGWRETVFHVHGPRITTQSRLPFSPERLNLEHLRHLTRVPDGFQIARIDLDLAQRIHAEVSADLLLSEVFPSPADFVERGIGFCALAGERLVCGATSAVICDGAIEVQVNSNAPFRRLGLATAVSATLLVHCLERGITPDWETASPASERLAKKLGYVPENTYEWLVLPD